MFLVWILGFIYVLEGRRVASVAHLWFLDPIVIDLCYNYVATYHSVSGRCKCLYFGPLIPLTEVVIRKTLARHLDRYSESLSEWILSVL